MMHKPYYVVIAAVLSLSSMSIHAASDCKGLEETACAGNPACTWNKGYTRSDGKAVAAHCKAKAGNKAAAEAAPAPVPAPQAATK